VSSGAPEAIAAIASPAGEGAIALIRVSGAGAIDIADRIFRGRQKPSEFASHVQHLGEIVDGERMIDQVVVSVHRAPHSYTGEDLVEISCHGGVLVTARVLGVCLAAGARAARAGEFTERAFLNGKMDLTQAEAVIDMIRATTDLALRSATEQLQGRLGAAVKSIRDQLIELLAHVEAAIDFPDEDLAPDNGERLRSRLDQIRAEIARLLATAEQGRIMREGVRVVIYGATNAGKSSLLNRLLGYDRAIVSEIPGTTRDTIEEVINMRGVPLRLLDTAGLRDSSDPLERAGIARTERSLEPPIWSCTWSTAARRSLGLRGASKRPGGNSPAEQERSPRTRGLGRLRCAADFVRRGRWTCGIGRENFEHDRSKRSAGGKLARDQCATSRLSTARSRCL
jgi:tRNA modification GTPase